VTNAPLIILDPGHGGSESGAVANSMTEKDIALEIVLRVRDNLVASGYQVLMTRNTDVTVALGSRGTLCGSTAGAAAFVSIHVNAGGGTGSEAYYANNALASANQSLAARLSNAVATKIGFANRGAKDGSALRVLKDCANVPATLVETAFIDAPSSTPDVNALRNRRADFAAAIADAIRANFPYRPTVFSGNVSSTLYFDNNGDRINLQVCADNLIGQSVRAQLSRAGRTWSVVSQIATSRCVTFWDMDGAGATWTNTIYTTRAALNQNPNPVWNATGCFATTGGQGLCDSKSR
jgi:hypothetical protein